MTNQKRNEVVKAILSKHGPALRAYWLHTVTKRSTTHLRQLYPNRKILNSTTISDMVFIYRATSAHIEANSPGPWTADVPRSLRKQCRDERDINLP